MKRGTIAVAAALAGTLLGTGCGAEAEPTPAACLAGADAYLEALADAPGEVRLGGGTPISACLVKDQPAGELSAVSRAAVGAATELNRRLLERFDQRTAVELGYLVGAVQEGAARTGGIHRDLVLRLDSAARNPGGARGGLGVRFERAFGSGYAAGQASG